MGILNLRQEDLNKTMNDSIILQQIYPGLGYSNLIEFTIGQTMRYCQRHNFDYKLDVSNVVDWPPENGGWAKLLLIRDALEKYKYVVWLDADAMIVDMDADLRDAVSDGIGVTQNHFPEHHNVGMLYVRSSLAVTKFFDAWIAEYPGYDFWREQRVFNDMVLLYPDLVHTIPDKYNSCWNNNYCDDRIVATFHGCGNWQERLELMKKEARGELK
jgi:hypothetical protein